MRFARKAYIGPPTEPVAVRLLNRREQQQQQVHLPLHLRLCSDVSKVVEDVSFERTRFVRKKYTTRVI
jgi:hypothetical protein